MADRIVVMNHGVIEQVGTPTEIYREPDTLFVADFIGEMNKIPGKATGNDDVVVGGSTLATRPYSSKPDGSVIVTIRPEDIVPHGKQAISPDAQDSGAPAENSYTATVEDMEFLGSFWRITLISDALGNENLIADMSINAVRRMNIAIGETIAVELPAERIWVFPTGDTNE
jgi:iron(III) transport system ATP-binding protein